MPVSQDHAELRDHTLLPNPFTLRLCSVQASRHCPRTRCCTGTAAARAPRCARCWRHRRSWRRPCTRAWWRTWRSGLRASGSGAAWQKCSALASPVKLGALRSPIGVGVAIIGLLPQMCECRVCLLHGRQGAHPCQSCNLEAGALIINGSGGRRGGSLGGTCIAARPFFSRTAPHCWTNNAINLKLPEPPQVQRLSDAVTEAKAAAKALCDAARPPPPAAQRPANPAPNGFVKRARASAGSVDGEELPAKRHGGGHGHAALRDDSVRWAIAGGAGAREGGRLPAGRHGDAGAHAAPGASGRQGSAAGGAGEQDGLPAEGHEGGGACSQPDCRQGSTARGAAGGAGAQGLCSGEPASAGHDCAAVSQGWAEGAEPGLLDEGAGQAAGALHAEAAVLAGGLASEVPAPGASAGVEPTGAAAAAGPGAFASTQDPGSGVSVEGSGTAGAHGGMAAPASALRGGPRVGRSGAAAAGLENPAPSAGAPAPAKALLVARAAGPRASTDGTPAGVVPAGDGTEHAMAATRVSAGASVAGAPAAAAAAGGASARAGPVAGSRARGADRVPAELLRLLDGGLGLGGPGSTQGPRRAAARPAPMPQGSESGSESEPERAPAPARMGGRGRVRGRGRAGVTGAATGARGRASVGAKRKSVSITEMARGAAAGVPKTQTPKPCVNPTAGALRKPGDAGEVAGAARGRAKKRACADSLSADLGCVMAYKVCP